MTENDTMTEIDVSTALSADLMSRREAILRMSALLGGVAWHLTAESSELPVLVLAVVALSMLVSYERAKAEALGFSARGGLIERFERLVHRRVRIVGVSLVEIDAIRLKAPQRFLHVPLDLRALQSLRALDLHAHLGRDEHLVALAALRKPFADDRLRLAAHVPGHPARVHVGGVDEVHAGVDPGVEEAKRHLLVDGPAEDVAAEADRRDIEAGTAERAQLDRGLFHGVASIVAGLAGARPAMADT